MAIDHSTRRPSGHPSNRQLKITLGNRLYVTINQIGQTTERGMFGNQMPNSSKRGVASSENDPEFHSRKASGHHTARDIDGINTTNLTIPIAIASP